jgi:ESS family glutamate:Na+ symporter
MLGMGVASTFGLDPRAGLLVGSISLVGGIGTTLAWVPDFTERLGITNALEIGTAGSMLGLIIACIIGGPIANYLMREHKLQPSHDARLEIGVVHGADSADTRLDYYGVLRAWLWLNLALLLGQGLASMIRSTGLNLPDFVGSLLAGIVLRNITPLILPRQSARNWKKVSQGLALISDICLGMFLTMALMGLQLWALKGVFGFVFSTLVLQVILTLFYTIWVVFRFMGKDYEAAVLCAGFGGIALGSTSTAVANMSAVTRQYGAAHRAFIIVPLVGGFFIDLVNALVISWLSR